jgi:hypothetical protein
LAICAYCGDDRVLTREHLLPAGLRRRLIANDLGERRFWLSRIQREIANEPTVRDVCEYCNNVPLSALDDYICRLFDDELCRMPQRYERIRLNFDYHLLKRAVLKLCFNSARVNNSYDTKDFRKVLPYILGVDNRLGRSVQLLAFLNFPEEIPEYELTEDDPPERPFIFFPTTNRIGHILFPLSSGDRRLIRFVCLQSFAFAVFFLRQGEKQSIFTEFSAEFSTELSAVALRPSMSCVELMCDGMGAYSSLVDARNNRISVISESALAVELWRNP